MSSSEEDDYMSDTLLLGTDNVRPGLLFSKAQKRTHELLKKKENAKKPKTKTEQEKESRELGLNTPITEENKGYKLLMKMGFKPGNKIGSNKDSTSGLNEPIKVVAKDTKSGLGHDTAVVEKQNKIIQAHKEKTRQLFDDYRSNTYQKKYQQLIAKDYERAQKICQDLDVRSDVAEPVQPWFWPKVEKDDETDEEDEDEEEEPEEEPVANNLSRIIVYLRDNYNYCIYCAVQFEDNADMQQSCPGNSREEHDN